jgi:hypothetical protein
MTLYPARSACWLGPRGGAAHSQVHWQIRATLRGTWPSPGIMTRAAKFAVSNAPNTSATLAPDAV